MILTAITINAFAFLLAFSHGFVSGEDDPDYPASPIVLMVACALWTVSVLLAWG